MARKPRGLVASMEEFAETSIVQPVSILDNNGDNQLAEATIIIPEGADRPETALIEIMDSEETVNQVEDEIHEGLMASDQLQAMHDTAVQSLDTNNGLSVPAAAIMTVSLEDLYGRLGITNSKMPAVEDFAGSSMRLRSTKIAIEDIKQNLKRIWQALINGLKRMVEAMDTFFDNVFHGCTILSINAKNLKRIAQGISGQPSARFVENSRIASNLNINGLFPANFMKALQENIDVAEAVFSVSTDWSTGVAKEFTALIKNPQTATFSDLLEKSGLAFQGLKKVPDESLPVGVERFETIPLFGNRVVAYNLLAGGEIKSDLLLEAIDEVGGDVEYVEAARDVSPKIPVLSTKDVGTLIDHAINYINEIERYRRKMAEIKQVSRDLIKVAQEQDDSGAEASDENRDKLRVGQRLAMTIPRLLREPAKSYSSYAVNTVRELLNYAELCIKAYHGNTEE